MPTKTRITDWVSFTLKDYTDVAAVLERFGLEFMHCENGMHGYKGQYACDGGSIRILYDGSSSMGVHVQISGAGCRLLEGLGLVADWTRFFAEWLELGASFTRVDLAVDSFDAAASLDQVRDHLASRSVTSRWRKYSELRQATVQDGQPMGAGIYFGSESSDVRLRIYDKALESASKGVECQGPWTRFEYQARRERAHHLAGLIGAGRLEDAFGVLRSYLEFREYRLESNPSMAPVASWWETLLDCPKLIVRAVEVVRASVDRLHRWIERQVAPALAVLVDREGGDVFGALAEYAVDGRSRWKDRHKMMSIASFAQ
jgi:phage replication initiation protein